jgi:TRAP-type C4-dicarboxylate transport system substrate-binding protein
LDGEIVKQFKQKGLTVDTLDAKAIQDMKALMKPVYEKYKDKFGVDAFKTFGYTF